MFLCTSTDAAFTFFLFAQEVAKLAITIAQGFVQIARGAVWFGKRVLHTVHQLMDFCKLLWSAALWIVKGVINAILGVKYAMLEATLSLNLLNTCIRGEEPCLQP